MTSRRDLLRGSAAAAIVAAAGTFAGTVAAEPAVAAIPSDDRCDDAFHAALEQIVADGATAAIARWDSPTGRWAGASGVAKLGHRRAPSPSGRFRVGSITKTFTSTVIGQLADEHRLSLDDTVERWLPGMIANGSRITIRQLLQHTSGIANYTDVLLTSLDDFLRIRFRAFTPRELVSLIDDQPPVFDPGTSWSYSNTNYVLLGLIVERATGRHWRDEVTRRIIGPLGLRDTTIPGVEPEIRGPHAHGYWPVDQADQVVPLDVTVLNPSWAWAAGEIISTTADLNRFYRGLLRGRLLRPQRLREMLTPTGPADYGLGIYRVVLPGGPTLWGHDGGIPGYISVSFSTEDTDRQLTVSINPWVGDFSPALSNLFITAFGASEITARSAVRFPRLDRLP